MNTDDNLRVQINTSGFTLSADEREKLQTATHTLSRAVSGFPVAELHVDMTRYARSNEIHVKTSLRLTKRTLSTGQRDTLLYFAYERCISRLLKKLTAYKEDLGNKELYQKESDGTLKWVEPSVEPDLMRLSQAALDRDYSVFRDVLSVYDEALSARIGRWVQRFPEIEARIGRDVNISEIVEEVYLNAFEQFETRPAIRFGDWLEQLIDPSVKALINDPDEQQNVSFVATAG